MNRESAHGAAQVVGMYAVIAAAWITLSDYLVTLILQDLGAIKFASIGKGLLFVLVTSAILYHLIVRLLDREHALQEARQQDQQLVAQLLDNSDDAIFAKDLDGRYLMANREVLNVFHKPAADVLGQDDSALFPPDQAQMIRANDLAVIRGNKIIAYEETLQTARGEVTYSAVKGPLHRSDGSVRGLFGISRDITSYKALEAALQENNERLGLLINHAPAALALFDRDMRYLAVSRRWMEDYKLGDRNLIGACHYDVFPEINEDWKAIHRRALAGESIASSGDRFVRADGSSQWIRWDVRPWTHGDGTIGGIVIFSEDITREKEAETLARVTARVFDQAGEAIMIAGPNLVIQTVNGAFCRLSGYTPSEAVGQPTSLLRSGRHDQEFYQHMWHEISTNGYWQGEILNRRKNGEIFPEWLTITRVDDERGEVAHYVAVFSDISQIKESQRKVEFLATHDVLTELPNRVLFYDRLTQAIGKARRAQSRVALLFVDLDNFKTINDTLGHDAGDLVLQHAARRLRQALREDDTLARLGDDEFTIIVSECTDDLVDSLAARIVSQFGSPFVLPDHSLTVSASMGIAFYPSDGEDASNLIKSADSAMYRAKEMGRNRVEFFVPDLRERLEKRAKIEAALRQAITQNELRLVFQPQIALSAHHPMVGAEALLRWLSPDFGEVSPGDFIPIAEHSGLIADVDRITQHLLMAQLANWRARGVAVPPIAFNVSPRSIGVGSFSSQLISLLREFDVPSDAIQVEITEGALLEGSEIVMANLHELANAGIAVSLDDFGTGYSSLSYLKRLRLQELKLDKSFVNGLGRNREDEAIARAVLALAKSTDLQTVAEGVESAEQLAWLEREGCNIAQGFYFHRPLEAAAFAELLKATGA